MLRGDDDRVVLIVDDDSAGERRASVPGEQRDPPGPRAAEGKGLSMPVAENSSIGGRATNRRAEIVVEPKPASAKTATAP